MLKRLSVSAKVRSHGWAMPPCVRMRSTTPRAHGTVRSGPAPSRASWTSWRAAAATADSATRRISSTWTCAVTVPVSSRVRPRREESPNSSVAANDMRFATARRTRSSGFSFFQ